MYDFDMKRNVEMAKLYCSNNLYAVQCTRKNMRKKWVMKCTLDNIFGHFKSNCFWERNMTEKVLCD
jgi:hypothetical protein